jgi:hypothetical protein
MKLRLVCFALNITWRPPAHEFEIRSRRSILAIRRVIGKGLHQIRAHRMEGLGY